MRRKTTFLMWGSKSMRPLINLDHLTFKEGGGGGRRELKNWFVQQYFFSPGSVFLCLKSFHNPGPPQKLNGPPLIVVFLFFKKTPNIWDFFIKKVKYYAKEKSSRKRKNRKEKKLKNWSRRELNWEPLKCQVKGP